VEIKKYKVADMVIGVYSKVPFLNGAFDPKFKSFETDTGACDVLLSYFTNNPPKVTNITNFPTNYQNWKVGYTKRIWTYTYSSEKELPIQYCVNSFYNKTHTRAKLFLDISDTGLLDKNKFQALSLFSTDQPLISRALLYNHGLLLHGNCIKIGEKTFLLLGNSGVGKSTLSTVLTDCGGQLISDDRTIVRIIEQKIFVYGSWLHGSTKIITNTKNELDGCILLEHATTNKLEELRVPELKANILLSSLIRPLIKNEEWVVLLNSVLELKTLPFYKLMFNLDTTKREQFSLIRSI